MVFEVIAPEAAIAVLSQQWSVRGRFGDVTQALSTFTLQQTMVAALVVIVCITVAHVGTLTALCVAPRDTDGGGGLLSFSACCPNAAADWNQTRYVDEDEARRGSCWMHEHYPATCHGLSGPGDTWPWGEACVPRS